MRILFLTVFETYCNLWYISFAVRIDKQKIKRLKQNMKLFKSIFNKKNKKELIILPSWAEIVEIMHDKGLVFSDDVKIEMVIYSVDKAKRFIVLYSNKGFFKYNYEILRSFDEDELQWMGKDALPAFWAPIDDTCCSLYGTMSEAIKELKSEPEFKSNFDINEI